MKELAAEINTRVAWGMIDTLDAAFSQWLMLPWYKRLWYWLVSV